jgi:hypothetical protein
MQCSCVWMHRATPMHILQYELCICSMKWRCDSRNQRVKKEENMPALADGRRHTLALRTARLLLCPRLKRSFLRSSSSRPASLCNR